MLRREAFKWDWVLKNALQLLTFLTLTRSMVGELKLENLMQGSEFLFPLGFVLKKGNRIYAKVQRNSAETKIEVELSEGKYGIVSTDFFIYSESHSLKAGILLNDVNLNLLLKMKIKWEMLSPKQSCPFCLTSGSTPARRS